MGDRVTWLDWATWIDVAVLAVILVSGLTWYGWYRYRDEHPSSRRNTVGLCLGCGALSAIAGCLIGRM